MSKVTLSHISSTYASTALHNSNYDAIEAAFDNTLSRDGSSPNFMGANIDMNSHRVINLPYPGSSTEPIRRDDGTALFAPFIASAQSAANNAASSASAAAGSAGSASGYASAASSAASSASSSASAAADSATAAGSAAALAGAPIEVLTSTNRVILLSDKAKTIVVNASGANRTLTLDKSFGTAGNIFYFDIERSPADTSGNEIYLVDLVGNLLGAIASPSNLGMVPSLKVRSNGTYITCRGIN